MANLQSTSFIGQTARRLGRNEFWRWWTSELRAAFAPLAPFAARWLAEEADVTELTLAKQALTVVDAGTNANPAAVSPIDLQDVDADVLRRSVEAALRDRPLDLHIALTAEVCLQKRVIYPQATEENLREVLGFDMDRQTPFAAPQVYFDARVVERIAGTGDKAENASITVELVAVPRYVLDPVLVALRACGARVRSISIAGDAGSRRFELVPEGERPRQRLTSRQILNLAIGGVIALFSIIALLLPIWQKQELIRELLPLVEQTRAGAEVTRRVESEFTQRAQEYNFAVGKKHAAYPAVEILDELSRLSPDTTWLQTLEMKSTAGRAGAMTREVQVTGEAASASHMIELFEQSKLLQNASQRSQTTRGSQTGTERFQIASEVKARALPTAIAFASSQAGKDAALLPSVPLAVPAAKVTAPVVEAAAVTPVPATPTPAGATTPPLRTGTQGMQP